MLYSISDAARAAGISASALRYYDREGLIPDVERSSGGARLFTERDLSWIAVIERLKESGLTIKEIRRYTELARRGDATIGERRQLLRERKEAVEAELKKLRHTLEFITYKCWFYDKAEELGSEAAVYALPDDQVPPEMLAIRARCLASRF